MTQRRSTISRQDLTDEQYQAVAHLFTVIRDLKAKLAYRVAA